MAESQGNSLCQGQENWAGVGDRTSLEVELLAVSKFRQVGRPFKNTSLESRAKVLCNPEVSGTGSVTNLPGFEF